MKTTEELIAENAVLVCENARLKKRVRELEHGRQLDQAEIIGLRRQIEGWEVAENSRTRADCEVSG